MRTLRARPLRPEDYAPFGEVVMASPGGEQGRPANLGTARRFDRLARLQNLRGDGALLDVSVFRVQPRLAFPFELRLLERHPASTQLFVPMSARRYLVIVAPGGDVPDLDGLAAFVAEGTQGVSYHPGIWHHPLIGLDAEADFACLVHEDGSERDCVLWAVPEAEIVRIELPQ